MLRPKRLRPVLAILFGALMFTLGAWTLSGPDDKNSLILKLMLQSLSNSHFANMPVDDNFSQKAFDLYLKRLDYNKRFLLKSDVEEMKGFEIKIDDEVSAGAFNLFNLSLKLIKTRTDYTARICEEILSQPFDYSVEEFVETSPDKRDYASSEAELKELWRKMLKYETLIRLNDLMDKQEKATGDEAGAEAKKSFEELEKEARERIKKNYDDMYIRLAKLRDSDWRERYLNSIANVFDPHTGYFAPEEKTRFDTDMAGQFEGIGARLQEQVDGYIKVTEIMPGGPAAKDGHLEPDDLILKVAQANTEPVSVVDMRVDDAVKLIRGPKGTEVRLTVRKKSGQEQVIPLMRDIVNIEETFARSLIVTEGSGKAPVGYIDLPRFYADFNNPNGRFCSKDMAKEVEKLKAEGVKGIVIDLRYNGGGSLEDVVKIAGLFIEQGPVVQVKGRAGSPYIYYDRDPSIQYDGPLVILVNYASASASEILAAAMQDYKRALIMGTPTYGKGTVQRFFNLDDLISGNSDIKPLGAVKLTMQKFYRINGTTTQLKGVTPDVVLPDPYLYIDSGEKEQPYPLAWDEITPLPYKPWVTTGSYLDKAAQKSEVRVKQHPIFSKLQENALEVKSDRDKTRYPLQLQAFRAWMQEEKQQNDAYKKLFEAIPGMSAQVLTADNSYVKADPEREKTFNKWVEEIQKDPYVFEAIQAVRDIR